MAVPDAVLLLVMRRAHARIHVEHDASRRATAVHEVNRLTSAYHPLSTKCSYNPETGRFEDAWIWEDLLGEDFIASVKRSGEVGAPTQKPD